MITYEDGRGIWTAKGDINEIYDTLGILEGAAAGAVPPIITPKDLERLEEYNRRMWQFAEEGDLIHIWPLEP